MKKQKFIVGSRVKFAEEKQAYRVRACSDRYLVCTKPHNLRRTVLYTIVDLVEGMRGPEDLVFGLGQETREQCRDTLRRVAGGETGISHRNRIPLDIEWVKRGGNR